MVELPRNEKRPVGGVGLGRRSAFDPPATRRDNLGQRFAEVVALISK